MDSETLKKANGLAKKIEYAKRDDGIALCAARQPYYLMVGMNKDRSEYISSLSEEQKRMIATMIAAFTSQNVEAFEAELAAL